MLQILYSIFTWTSFICSANNIIPVPCWADNASWHLTNCIVFPGWDEQPGVPPASSHQHPGRHGSLAHLRRRQRSLLRPLQHCDVDQSSPSKIPSGYSLFRDPLLLWFCRRSYLIMITLYCHWSPPCFIHHALPPLFQRPGVALWPPPCGASAGLSSCAWTPGTAAGRPPRETASGGSCARRPPFKQTRTTCWPALQTSISRVGILCKKILQFNSDALFFTVFRIRIQIESGSSRLKKRKKWKNFSCL